MCLCDNEKVSRKKAISGKNLSGALILFGGVYSLIKKEQHKKITYYLKLLNYLFIYLYISYLGSVLIRYNSNLSLPTGDI